MNPNPFISMTNTELYRFYINWKKAGVNPIEFNGVIEPMMEVYRKESKVPQMLLTMDLLVEIARRWGDLIGVITKD